MKAPNIILCTCDQLRAFEVGSYGHPVVQTPNIDALAGTRFQLAISNNPVCVPARSALLTGQYSRTCAGRLDNAYADDGPVADRLRLPDVTIAEHFQRHGYRTSLIGKWHMYPDPLISGFDSAYYPAVAHRYRGQTYFERLGIRSTVNEFTPEVEADRVDEFLLREHGAPFFLSYNISLPHQPIWEGIPDSYRRRYGREDVLLRENVFQDGVMSRSDFWFRVYCYADFFWEWLADRRAGGDGIDNSKYPLPHDAFDLRDLTALYYGAISYVDSLVGRMRETLKAAGLAENTIVVFLSDHGDNLGSHDSYNKGLVIEESLRIPLVLYDPRYAPIENTTQVAQTIDVYPTLSAAAGLAVPDHLQGRDLSPIVRGETAIVAPNYAVSETSAGVVGIRTPEWLYARTLSEDRLRFIDSCTYSFNLQADPFETENLRSTPAADPAGLSDLLESWNQTTPWLNGAPG